MDNPEMMETAEEQFDKFINEAHNSGLSYWQILRIVLPRLESLVMQADVEYHMKLS